MAAQNPLKSMQGALGNVVRAAGDSAKSNMSQTVEKLGQDAVGSFAEQAGMGAMQEMEDQQLKAVQEEEDYRAKTKAEEEAKLAELSRRLTQLTYEMDQARGIRNQETRQYIQQQDQMMRLQDMGGKTEEEYAQAQRAQQELPAAVKARQGTGETGKRNRKG